MSQLRLVCGVDKNDRYGWGTEVKHKRPAARCCKAHCLARYLARLYKLERHHKYYRATDFVRPGPTRSYAQNDRSISCWPERGLVEFL